MYNNNCWWNIKIGTHFCKIGNSKNGPSSYTLKIINFKCITFRKFFMQNEKIYILHCIHNNPIFIFFAGYMWIVN